MKTESRLGPAESHLPGMAVKIAIGFRARSAPVSDVGSFYVSRANVVRLSTWKTGRSSGQVEHGDVACRT
jgi:hypothetical protein